MLLTYIYFNKITDKTAMMLPI